MSLLFAVAKSLSRLSGEYDSSATVPSDAALIQRDCIAARIRLAVRPVDARSTSTPRSAAAADQGGRHGMTESGPVSSAPTVPLRRCIALRLRLRSSVRTPRFDARRPRRRIHP